MLVRRSSVGNRSVDYDSGGLMDSLRRRCLEFCVVAKRGEDNANANAKEKTNFRESE